MPVLRSGQSGGLEVLQLLRRSIAPPTAPCIVPALRGGEPGHSDRLLLVQEPDAAGKVFAAPALSSDRRHSGSRGSCRRRLLHPPPALLRRRASSASRKQRLERAPRSRRR